MSSKLKHIRVGFITLLILCAGFVSMGFAGLDDGLVLHYSFDAAPNAGLIADQSARHNDGTVVGNPALVPGRVNGAWSFNGTNDYIWRLGNASLDVGTQFTCSIWYKATTYNVQRPLMEWCLTAAGYGNDFGAHLWCNIHGGDWIGSGANLVTGWGHAGIAHIISVPDLTLNAWHHMVVTFSQGTGVALLYFDGLVVASNNFGSIRPSTTADFYIGRRPSLSTAFWHGLLDDARVYNRVLSAEEVKTLHNLPASADDGLVLYYSFDTDFNGWVADESGSCNNGVLRGGAARVTNGACDAAFYFDGTDDDIRVPNTPSLNPTNEITLASWFKCDGPGRYNGIILMKGTSYRTSDAGEYGLVYFPNNDQGVQGKVAFSLRTTDAGWWREYYSVFTLKTGVWYHVVGTYKPGEWSLYVNGTLACAPVTTWHGSIRPQAGDLYIGSEHSFPNDEYFKGNIDEVRIYNRCLSAAEVSNLYLRCGPADDGGVTVESPYILKVGFSTQPDGDQDVTEFFTDESLFIKVHDVSLEADSDARTRAILRQGRRRTVFVNLARQSDGSFTGAVPLNKFTPGPLRVTIQGFIPNRTLMKDTDIMLYAPTTTR